MGWPLFASDWTGPGDLGSTTQPGGGFGVFDWALIVNTDSAPKNVLIGPGENVVFLMAISGTGPFDMGDFGTELSVDPGDIEPAILTLAAGKFKGLDDGTFRNLSGFGATIPEPSTLALLGIGALTVLRRRATAFQA